MFLSSLDEFFIILCDLGVVPVRVRPRPIFPMSLLRRAVHQGTFQLWLNGNGRS